MSMPLAYTQPTLLETRIEEIEGLKSEKSKKNLYYYPIRNWMGSVLIFFLFEGLGFGEREREREKGTAAAGEGVTVTPLGFCDHIVI